MQPRAPVSRGLGQVPSRLVFGDTWAEHISLALAKNEDKSRYSGQQNPIGQVSRCVSLHAHPRVLDDEN